jgi:hypothetical protein
VEEEGKDERDEKDERDRVDGVDEVDGVDRSDGLVGSLGSDEMDGGRGWDGHGQARTNTDGMVREYAISQNSPALSSFLKNRFMPRRNRPMILLGGG